MIENLKKEIFQLILKDIDLYPENWVRTTYVLGSIKGMPCNINYRSQKIFFYFEYYAIVNINEEKFELKISKDEYAKLLSIQEPENQNTN